MNSISPTLSRIATYIMFFAAAVACSGTALADPPSQSTTASSLEAGAPVLKLHGIHWLDQPESIAAALKVGEREMTRLSGRVILMKISPDLFNVPPLIANSITLLFTTDPEKEVEQLTSISVVIEKSSAASIDARLAALKRALGAPSLDLVHRDYVNTRNYGGIHYVCDRNSTMDRRTTLWRGNHMFAKSEGEGVVLQFDKTGTDIGPEIRAFDRMIGDNCAVVAD